MATQKDLDRVYLSICKVVSTLSHARRASVGALVVKGTHIIAEGFNGTPSGMDNRCEIGGVTKPSVIHAEMNCILKLAKSTQSALGGTLYVTMSPCVECAKAIIQSGITRVVFSDGYRDPSGILLLKEANVTIERSGFHQPGDWWEG